MIGKAHLVPSSHSVAVLKPIGAVANVIQLIGLFSMHGFGINGLPATLVAVAATAYPKTPWPTGVGMAPGDLAQC